MTTATNQRVQRTQNTGEWHVEMTYQMNDGQHMTLALNVQMAHPSPRVTDLERLVLQQAHTVLAHMLEHQPERQDK